MYDKALIVRPDYTVLLETNHPEFPALRSTLSRYAELIKTPPHLHTYRISSISLWNAASTGVKADEVIRFLQEHSKFGAKGVPAAVIQFIQSCMDKFHLFRLEQEGGQLILHAEDQNVMRQLAQYSSIQKMLLKRIHDRVWAVDSSCRGMLKQEFIRLGYPILDLAGYQSGESFPIRLRSTSLSGKPFQLRDYQQSAVDAFYQQGSNQGGSGLLVLPCGAGKTIIGIGVMAKLNCEVLILTTNATSVRQWKEEIIDKTFVTEEQIGEYSGSKKQVRPITIATYQILTYRKTKQSDFEHMKLFQQRNWGLIIYDEVHLLPAPVFRATADIQAKRRLGLTATLIREDGLQEDVFSLVGPKKYDVPWKDMEEKGWIAKVKCTEIRVPLLENDDYQHASQKEKFRIACENPLKEIVIAKLLQKHEGMPVLIIGQYLNQLESIAKQFRFPLITGKVSEKERQSVYKQFREGKLKGIVVSKVANFALDLPDASVLIQVSGSFGSRQEEAQRMGRILRPKSGRNEAYFYTIVSKQTVEQDFSMKRQLFLIEQGYQYEAADDGGDAVSLQGRKDDEVQGYASGYAAANQETNQRRASAAR